MDGVEREYAYQPRWWAILLGLSYFGLGAVVALAAVGAGHLPALYWAVCALCFVGVALVGARAVGRLLLRQRVALTRSGLLLPRSLWSAEEVVLDYRAITGLFISSGVYAPRLCRVALDCRAADGWPTRKVKQALFLYVAHVGGERRVVAAALPSHAAFEELCGLLAARVGAAQQGGRS